MFPPCKYSDLIYTLFPAIFSFLPEAAARKSRRSHKVPLLSAGEGKLQDQRYTGSQKKTLLNPSRFCQQKLLRKERRQNQTSYSSSHHVQIFQRGSVYQKRRQKYKKIWQNKSTKRHFHCVPANLHVIDVCHLPGNNRCRRHRPRQI